MLWRRGKKGFTVQENFSAIRVNIHNCDDGRRRHRFHCQDSYIHDLATSPIAPQRRDPAQDAINVTIEHNTIYGVDTSASTSHGRPFDFARCAGQRQSARGGRLDAVLSRPTIYQRPNCG